MILNKKKKLFLAYYENKNFIVNSVIFFYML